MQRILDDTDVLELNVPEGEARENLRDPIAPTNIPKAVVDPDEAIMDLFNPYSDLYTTASRASRSGKVEDTRPKEPTRLEYISEENRQSIVKSNEHCVNCGWLLDNKIYWLCEMLHLYCQTCFEISGECGIVENMKKCGTSITQAHNTGDFRFPTKTMPIVDEAPPRRFSKTTSSTSGMPLVTRTGECVFRRCKYLLELPQVESLEYEKSCQALLSHLTGYHKVPVLERLVSIFQVDVTWSRIQELEDRKKGTSAVATILKHQEYNFLLLIGSNDATFFYEIILLKHRPEIDLGDVFTLSGFVLMHEWLTYYSPREIGLWQIDPASRVCREEKRTCYSISLEELRETYLRNKGKKNECIVIDVNFSVHLYPPMSTYSSFPRIKKTDYFKPNPLLRGYTE